VMAVLAEARHAVLTSGRQLVFRGLESSPSSTASSAWRHATTAAEARPSPTAERNVAVEHGDGRICIIIYNFSTHVAEGDVYGADQQRRARVCRIALGEPATPRRGAWSAGAGSSSLYVVTPYSIYIYTMPYPYICYY